jgi:hypothetical protein
MKLLEIKRAGQPTLYLNPLFVTGVQQGPSGKGGTLFMSQFKNGVAEEIPIDDVEAVVQRIDSVFKR